MLQTNHHSFKPLRNKLLSPPKLVTLTNLCLAQAPAYNQYLQKPIQIMYLRRRQQAQQQNYLSLQLRNQRNRERFSAYEYDRNYGPCIHCSDYHRNQAEKCYMMCHYCHSIHFKQSFENHKYNKLFLCPLLSSTAVQQHNKKAYACDECGGNGLLEKNIHTTYLEPKEFFERRVRQYNKVQPLNGQPVTPPQRKVFKKAQESRQQVCQSCNGRGKHFRMVNCCQNGCNECGFSRLKLNFKWRLIRSKGQPNDQIFPCRICSDEVAVGDKIFKLHCGHTFHRSCIFSWLYRNEGCYTCKEVDPYLQIGDIPLQSLVQLNFVENATRIFCQNKKPYNFKQKKDVKKDSKKRFKQKNSDDSWATISQQSVWCNQSESHQASQKSICSVKNDSLLIIKVPQESGEREDLSLDFSMIQRETKNLQAVINAINAIENDNTESNQRSLIIQRSQLLENASQEISQIQSWLSQNSS